MPDRDTIFHRLEYGKYCHVEGGPVDPHVEHSRLGNSPNFPSPLLDKCSPSALGIPDSAESGYGERAFLLPTLADEGTLHFLFGRFETRQEISNSRAYSIGRFLTAKKASPWDFYTHMADHPLRGLTRKSDYSPLPQKPRPPFPITECHRAFLQRAVAILMSGRTIGIDRCDEEPVFWQLVDLLWNCLPAEAARYLSAAWGMRLKTTGKVSVSSPATESDHVFGVQPMAWYNRTDNDLKNGFQYIHFAYGLDRGLLMAEGSPPPPDLSFCGKDSPAVRAFTTGEKTNWEGRGPEDRPSRAPAWIPADFLAQRAPLYGQYFMALWRAEQWKSWLFQGICLHREAEVPLKEIHFPELVSVLLNALGACLAEKQDVNRRYRGDEACWRWMGEGSLTANHLPFIPPPGRIRAALWQAVQARSENVWAKIAGAATAGVGGSAPPDLLGALRRAMDEDVRRPSAKEEILDLVAKGIPAMCRSWFQERLEDIADLAAGSPRMDRARIAATLANDFGFEVPWLVPFAALLQGGRPGAECQRLREMDPPRTQWFRRWLDHFWLKNDACFSLDTLWQWRKALPDAPNDPLVRCSRGDDLPLESVRQLSRMIHPRGFPAEVLCSFSRQVLRFWDSLGPEIVTDYEAWRPVLQHWPEDWHYFLLGRECPSNVPQKLFKISPVRFFAKIKDCIIGKEENATPFPVPSFPAEYVQGTLEHWAERWQGEPSHRKQFIANCFWELASQAAPSPPGNAPAVGLTRHLARQNSLPAEESAPLLDVLFIRTLLEQPDGRPVLEAIEKNATAPWHLRFLAWGKSDREQGDLAWRHLERHNWQDAAVRNVMEGIVKPLLLRQGAGKTEWILRKARVAKAREWGGSRYNGAESVRTVDDKLEIADWFAPWLLLADGRRAGEVREAMLKGRK